MGVIGWGRWAWAAGPGGGGLTVAGHGPAGPSGGGLTVAGHGPAGPSGGCL
ncbi:hypothetical protein [Ammoniphilus sp. YIM 78166]|uniref:hypothetical protein n=1 Tax=Ammoniphilus sp. YIM 78166 TaxID=1644106 RepID=UPI00142FFC0C|nr:hypothetical protein [Ammoniphilus sp. YIM 78166]